MVFFSFSKNLSAILTIIAMMIVYIMSSIYGYFYSALDKVEFLFMEFMVGLLIICLSALIWLTKDIEKAVRI